MKTVRITEIGYVIRHDVRKVVLHAALSDNRIIVKEEQWLMSWEHEPAKAAVAIMNEYDAEQFTYQSMWVFLPIETLTPLRYVPNDFVDND